MKLRMEGLDLDRFSFPAMLKAAARTEGLLEGMQFHGLGAKFGFDSDPFVQTGLVGMYAACGRIADARLVFDKMSHRDVVTWSIMIDGYGELVTVGIVFAFGFLNFILIEKLKTGIVRVDFTMKLSTFLKR